MTGFKPGRQAEALTGQEGKQAEAGDDLLDTPCSF